MIRPGSLSPFDNIHPGSLDPFDINPSWFAWFLLLIYDSLVSFFIFLCFFVFFDNLWFVFSFDNTLFFFLLIIINLWFVCFFDDSIRVRLVTLHYIKQKCLPEASWLYWCH